MIMENKEQKMPKALKYYNNQDYILKKRTLFLYYFIITATVVSFLLLFSTSYLQLKNPRFEKLQLPVLLPILGAFISFTTSLVALIKGKFNLSANLLMTVSLVVIWLVIFLIKVME